DTFTGCWQRLSPAITRSGNPARQEASAPFRRAPRLVPPRAPLLRLAWRSGRYSTCHRRRAVFVEISTQLRVSEFFISKIGANIVFLAHPVALAWNLSTSSAALSLFSIQSLAIFLVLSGLNNVLVMSEKPSNSFFAPFPSSFIALTSLP